MQSISLARLFSVGLRGMTMVSKFLLIFFLAAFLEPSEVGLYGLITVTIAYAVYPLGFDFYIYSTRELLKLQRSEWGGLLKDQGVLHLFLYVIVMPLLLLIFVFELLPWFWVSWFFLILALEHLNQELMRLLIAFSEQLAASCVLFLRSGCWALVIAIWMCFEPGMRSLESVLAAWTLGGGLALAFAVYSLYQLRLTGWSKKINWAWMIKGLKVAVPFLVATVAVRAVFTIDRYWYEALQGLEMLGAYVLFMGVSNALMSFLDAAVFSFSYPGLMVAHNLGDFDAFRNGVRRLLLQTLILTLAFVVVAWLAIDPLLVFLNKPFYTEHLFLFPWVLVVMALHAIGMVPHYALYTQGIDKPIIYSHLAGLVAFLVTTWLLSTQTPERAVLIGLIASVKLMLVWKSLAFYRSISNKNALITSAEIG